VFTAAELAEHRGDAESRMVDTCRITRPGDGPRVPNPETLAYEGPAPVTVYEGKCRIPRRVAGSAQSSDAGEATWQVGEYPLAIPLDGDGYVAGETVGVGQTVEYLTSTTDPDLVGRSYGITGVSHQTHATERRFRMKEVVGT